MKERGFGPVAMFIVIVAVGLGCIYLVRMAPARPPPPKTCAQFANWYQKDVPARCFTTFDGDLPYEEE